MLPIPGFVLLILWVHTEQENHLFYGAIEKDTNGDTGYFSSANQWLPEISLFEFVDLLVRIPIY